MLTATVQHFLQILMNLQNFSVFFDISVFTKLYAAESVCNIHESQAVDLSTCFLLWTVTNSSSEGKETCYFSFNNFITILLFSHILKNFVNNDAVKSLQLSNDAINFCSTEPHRLPAPNSITRKVQLYKRGMFA